MDTDADRVAMIAGLGGVLAETDDVRAMVLLDIEDASVLSDRVQTTRYVMTYIAKDFPNLKHGDALIIDGIAYQVQTVNAIDDGKLKTATVERTTS